MPLDSRVRAQDFTLDACRGRAQLANEAVDLAVRLLARMKGFENVNVGALQDAFGLIHDAISDEAGKIERALDAEHLSVDLVTVDLSELDRAHAGIGK